MRVRLRYLKCARPDLPLSGPIPSCGTHSSSGISESVTSNAQQNVSLPNNATPLPSGDQRITLFSNCAVDKLSKSTTSETASEHS